MAWETIDQIYSGLAKKVEMYLDAHKHRFAPRFRLEDFEFCGFNSARQQVVCVILEGLSDEDLSDNDPDFDRGLADIGKEYGIWSMVFVFLCHPGRMKNNAFLRQ